MENDIRISDSKLKAQIFNDYFANQSTLINADVAPVPSLPTSPFSLSSIVVNESEVLCILYHVNVSKACGFDNISNKILKVPMTQNCTPNVYGCIVKIT